MVKALKEKDAPEPWFAKKSKGVTITPKQTRAASKQMAQHEVVEGDIVAEPSGKGEARAQGKGKEHVAVKGKKTAKAMPSKSADVVLGRSKYAVPDPEELRRKIVADAAACGRVVTSLHQRITRKSCPTTSIIETSEEEVHATMVTGELPCIMEHCASPYAATPHAEECNHTHAEECANDAANDVALTPPVARTSKECVHEGQQPAEERGISLQERGKRKAGGNAIVNCHSSGREDPEESAQKYRRIDTSPSPIILKERVGDVQFSLVLQRLKFQSALASARIPLKMYYAKHGRKELFLYHMSRFH